jgi:hypothetical protein
LVSDFVVGRLSGGRDFDVVDVDDAVWEEAGGGRQGTGEKKRRKPKLTGRTDYRVILFN